MYLNAVGVTLRAMEEGGGTTCIYIYIPLQYLFGPGTIDSLQGGSVLAGEKATPPAFIYLWAGMYICNLCFGIAKLYLRMYVYQFK